MVEHADVLVMMDNEALYMYDISRRSLCIEHSTYMCLERLMAQKKVF